MDGNKCTLYKESAHIFALVENTKLVEKFQMSKLSFSDFYYLMRKMAELLNTYQP